MPQKNLTYMRPEGLKNVINLIWISEKELDFKDGNSFIKNNLSSMINTIIITI